MSGSWPAESGRSDVPGDGDPLDDAVVVGANWYRFSSGERIVNPHVMSVSFVWVVAGSGEIRAGGQTFTVDGQHVVRLPWRHRVQYDAHRHKPFHIGTLHVVPRHDRREPVVPGVAHLPGDPMLGNPSRTGDPSAFRPEVTTMGNAAARRITELARIAIERLGDGGFEESYFRALGRLVMAESSRWSAVHAHEAALPGSLELMMTFIRHHIAEELPVARVAESAGCSDTTAQRLFVRHTGQPMQSWIRQLRMREAGNLLRTSGMRVSEVARLVGYPDPLYFSRAFRRAYGVAPSRFARASVRP